MSAKPAKDDEKKLVEDEKAPPDEDEEEQDDEADEDESDEEESDADDEEEEEEEPADEEDPDADEEDEDEDEEDEAPARGFGASEPEEAEDQYWWAPYAVLGALILVGLLGFFGLFNKMLAPKAPGGAASGSAMAAASAKPPSALGSAGADEARFGAKHILVAYKGARRAAQEITRSKEEGKARAAEVVDKIKKGGKFDDLVKDYSDEPGAAARQGNLGRFRKGTMDPAFQTAVEKLKVGETSDVVESPFGFHVIQRTF
jgi:parvulin-like peptidyl-prolyl isomerase